MTRCSDDVLLQRAAAGDDAAFAAFYRRHHPSLLGYFRARAGHRGDIAFDLAAETFAQVVGSLDRFDAERGPAIGWLYGVAANVLRTSLHTGRVQQTARERVAMGPVVVTDEDVRTIDRLAAQGAGPRLDELLALLPAEQRAAVLGRVVDEEDYEVLAERLTCSEALVRQRVTRGLRFLRTRMEGQQ